MALSYDFSVIIRRLGRTIYDLQGCEGDKMFPNNPPLVRDASCPLSECLLAMSTRGLRTCVVYYPNGIDRKASARPQRMPPLLNGYESTNDLSEKISVTPAESEASDVSSKEEELDRWAHRFYQFLDMRDVLYLLLENYHEVYGPNGEKSERPARAFLDEILQIPVGEAANMSGRNGYRSAGSNESLRLLLQKFEDSPRIPIFDVSNGVSNPPLMGVYSVIDFLQYLNSLATEESPPAAEFFVSGSDPTTAALRKPCLTPVDSWTAGRIKSATQPSRAKKYSELLICFEDESLFDAMKMLHKTGFSALPIVSRSNARQCLGVFSLRDLQPILLHTSVLSPSGALLAISIMDYVSNVRQTQSLKARYPVIRLRENATVDAVIGKILAANVRRVLLTDDDGLLTGILSVTDLGRFIARELAVIAR